VNEQLELNSPATMPTSLYYILTSIFASKSLITRSLLVTKMVGVSKKGWTAETEKVIVDYFEEHQDKDLLNSLPKDWKTKAVNEIAIKLRAAVNQDKKFSAIFDSDAIISKIKAIWQKRRLDKNACVRTWYAHGSAALDLRKKSRTSKVSYKYESDTDTDQPATREDGPVSTLPVGKKRKQSEGEDDGSYGTHLTSSPNGRAIKKPRIKADSKESKPKSTVSELDSAPEARSSKENNPNADVAHASADPENVEHSTSNIELQARPKSVAAAVVYRTEQDLANSHLERDEAEAVRRVMEAISEQIEGAVQLYLKSLDLAPDELLIFEPGCPNYAISCQLLCVVFRWDAESHTGRMRCFANSRYAVRLESFLRSLVGAALQLECLQPSLIQNSWLGKTQGQEMSSGIGTGVLRSINC
jgi:hypothetical protein